MKLIAPIYDRVLSDITNKTAKGYFNVLDWERVYNNVELLHILEVLILTSGTTFNAIATPTMSTIPTSVDINTLLENLEAIRIEFAPAPVGPVVLKTDWGGQQSPTYKEVNDWERNIVLLLAYIIDGYTDWIPDSGSPVRRTRTDVGICGVGLTRNNGWRRYD